MTDLRTPKIVEDRLIKLREVLEIAGLSKAMIYRKIRAGTFPKPFKPGGISSRWSEKEVRDWRTSIPRGA